MLLATLLVLVATAAAVSNQSYIADTGVFYSYNYPNNYDNNLHYFVTVEVDPTYYVFITMLDFITEPCCDKLYIWDGTDMTKSIANLSGAHTGDYYFSTTNKVVFEFYSDPSETYRGLAIKWEQTKDNTKIEMTNTCPPDIETASAGFITSPNWPANYPNNIDCSYKLSSTKNRVQLKFVAFQTEACCDKVVIYDGDNTSSPVLATLSGRSLTNTTFSSSGPNLFLDFTTDMSNNDVGFSAYYVSVT